MKKIFLLASAIGFLAACNNSGTSTENKKDTTGNTSTMSTGENKAERNRETALAGARGVNSHDVNAMLKDIAPDAVDYGDGTQKPVKSLDSIKAGITAWLHAFPDVKGEHLEAFSNADGSKVVVIGEWTGTFKNDFMGMKATGKSFKYWDGDLFSFNDAGKMTDHRSIQTAMTTMMQVGGKMPK